VTRRALKKTAQDHQDSRIGNPEVMKAMSILIIGGMGSIGSFVTRKFVELGLEPIVYARHKNLLFIRDIEKKVIYAEGDILDVDKLVTTIKTYHVDRIIHMAALLSAGSEANPAMSVRMNVEGTANVLEAAVTCNVKRVVYSSAKGAYSETTGDYAHPTYKPLPEDYPTDECMGFYGLTKLFGEKLGFKYQKKYGIEFIALRYSSTWGPGKLIGRAASPHGIHGTLIENPMLGKPVRHPQGAEQKDDLIYHKDSANGVVLACLSEKTAHSVFNIGTGVGSTLLEFANAVKKIYPKADIEIGPGLDYLMKHYNTYSIFDISRARKELGFSPQYDVEKGVVDYIEMMNRLNINPTYTPVKES
jgi:nucleoside-diphosphate-sugar epimerase